MKKISVCIILMTVALALTAGGTPYVSLKGDFYIIFPDEWGQIDFNTVDLFMQRRGVSLEGLDYDAVFAIKTNSPFFEGNYLIITVDTVGNLNDDQIDSVLKGMRTVFHEEVQYYPVGDLQADLKSNTPYYDRDQKLAIVLNEVTQRAESFKKNLLFYKFYDKGIAKFYCYSPDSLFEEGKPQFEQILASFSTENIESMLPTEDVELTDIDGSSSERSSTSRYGIPVAALVAVFIAIVAARRRRKSRQAS